MDIQKDVSLKPYNTFGIEARAGFFLQVNTVEELCAALQLPEHPHPFVLSGGSNILLTGDLSQLVLLIRLKGIEVLSQDKESVRLKVMAGENWHQLVQYAISHDYGGLENLSLIPGLTGTAPIQNIGAYGVELKDVFESCEAVERSSGDLEVFTAEACRFGYRDSYFKGEGKDRYIIASVTLKLSRNHHKLRTSYGAIEEELQKQGISKPGIRDVSNAVIAIRQSKLPDPEKLGNSGSFFKNPVISASEFREFTERHPQAPFYKVDEHSYKIPAGWLIEQCGFKGKRVGDAGVHAKQALVLVNYGNASGADILALARSIQREVNSRFGIPIEAEVNIIS